MTSINSKMGLKAAGKRSMMKLPTDRALRTLVTSAQCPQCGVRRASLSKTKQNHLWCSDCGHAWEIPQ
jgi:predicted RNA-binding Zn-ribbon protein involved in translation (DUF1610 family)